MLIDPLLVSLCVFFCPSFPPCFSASFSLSSLRCSDSIFVALSLASQYLSVYCLTCVSLCWCCCEMSALELPMIPFKEQEIRIEVFLFHKTKMQPKESQCTTNTMMWLHKTKHGFRANATRHLWLTPEILIFCNVGQLLTLAVPALEGCSLFQQPCPKLMELTSYLPCLVQTFIMPMAATLGFFQAHNSHKWEAPFPKVQLIGVTGCQVATIARKTPRATLAASYHISAKVFVLG